MTEVSQVNHYSQLIGQLEQRCATLTTERDLARAEARAAEARADEAEWQRDDWKRGNDMFVAAHNGSVKRAERAETKLRALRERMEALANFWWREDGSEAYSVAGSVARRHAGELREALGAPATEAHHDEESHEQASQSTEAPHATASAAIRAEGEAPARATPRPDRGHSEQASAVETAGTPGLDREHTADQRDAVPCVPRRDSVGEPPACADCGAELNEGEAKCFTVCDTCWAVVYPPNGEPPHGDAPTPQRDEATVELFATDGGQPCVVRKTRAQVHELFGWTCCTAPTGGPALPDVARALSDDATRMLAKAFARPGSVQLMNGPDLHAAGRELLALGIFDGVRLGEDTALPGMPGVRLNDAAREQWAEALSHAQPAPELPAGWTWAPFSDSTPRYLGPDGTAVCLLHGDVKVQDRTLLTASAPAAVLRALLAQHTPQARDGCDDSNASGGEQVPEAATPGGAAKGGRDTEPEHAHTSPAPALAEGTVPLGYRVESRTANDGSLRWWCERIDNDTPPGEYHTRAAAILACRQHAKSYAAVPSGCCWPHSADPSVHHRQCPEVVDRGASPGPDCTIVTREELYKWRANVDLAIRRLQTALGEQKRSTMPYEDDIGSLRAAMHMAIEALRKHNEAP